ncbi:hypothetical protein DFH27DRAFT_573853, partial [Peziza echinospora]
MHFRCLLLRPTQLLLHFCFLHLTLLLARIHPLLHHLLSPVLALKLLPEIGNVLRGTQYILQFSTQNSGPQALDQHIRVPLLGPQMFCGAQEI